METVRVLRRNKQKRYIYISLLLIFLSIIFYIFIKMVGESVVVSANEFNKLLSKEDVKEIYIKDRYLYLDTEDKSYKTLTNGVDITSLSKEYPIESLTKGSKYLNYIAVILLLSILIVIILILRREHPFPDSIEIVSSQDEKNKENLKSEIEPVPHTNIRFNDVVGIEDVKEDLEEIVEFLKNPFEFKLLDLKMPKGVLLVGPPGVGKTLLAKAIASEAGVPFFYHSGANFVEIYAGMGAKRVKELFEKAKKIAPSIIFIDEIDAVGKSRDKLHNEEREATLNQLLVEMDGFQDNLGVIVIGATNRVDILDTALLRPGRFDRKIFIGLPNLKEREQILKHYLAKKHYSFDIKEVAKITAGFSPAALEVLINEAALDAFKQENHLISMDNIYRVKDRIIYGKKRLKLYSSKEREILSYSQSAKGIVALWLGLSFEKLSLFLPFHLKLDDVIISKEVEKRRVKVFLSGILFLEKRYNDFFQISIEDKKEIEKILSNVRDYSYKREDVVDFLESEMEEVKEILDRLNSLIERLALKLREREVLTYEEIRREFDEIF